VTKHAENRREHTQKIEKVQAHLGMSVLEGVRSIARNGKTNPQSINEPVIHFLFDNGVKNSTVHGQDAQSNNHDEAEDINAGVQHFTKSKYFANLYNIYKTLNYKPLKKKKNRFDMYSHSHKFIPVKTSRPMTMVQFPPQPNLSNYSHYSTNKPPITRANAQDADFFEDDIPSSSATTWYTYFSTAYLNLSAAIFHGIQSVLVFALIGWLNGKAIVPKYIQNGTATTMTRFNSTLNQTETYNVSTQRELDFMNVRPGVFHLHRMINVWHKIDDKSSQAVLSVSEFGKIRAMSSDFFVEIRQLKSGEIDVRYVIACFFALSCIFQLLGGYFYNGKIGGRLRFVEYSFSASIMILAIGVESGIRDLYTLEMMFVLIWATMMLGLLAEVLSSISENLDAAAASEPILEWLGAWSWVIPHVAGWATCVAAYAPIIDNFYESNSASSSKAPGFVNIIVYLQFGLFSCFGFVQLYSLFRRTIVLNQGGEQPWTGGRFRGALSTTNKNRPLEDIADSTERMYIILSFSAKTLLAWLILSPIITDAI